MIHSKWLGLVGYREALELQQKIFNEVLETGQPQILGLEHKPVISLGVRSDKDLDLLWDKEKYNQHSIEIVETRRGGEATLHSPGQLVIYPIVSLKNYKLGAREFVDKIMLHTKGLLQSYDIKCERQCPEPGLYTDKGKIVFLGLKISRGVSYHGLSINVNNKLELFNGIRSCGVNQQDLDLVSNYKKISCKALFAEWSKNFLSTLKN